MARAAITLDDTLRIADHSLISGLSAATRGELPAGAHHLTKSMIASALAAWQLVQLSADANAEQNRSAAQSRRAAAEHQLSLVPERARLTVTALHATSGGDVFLPDVRATVTAFVYGFGVARSVFDGHRLAGWQRSLVKAFGVARDPVGSCQVNGIALPQMTAASGVSGGRSIAGDSRPKLSVREREVLGQIVGGLTTAEIALRLGVKTTTVATLVSRIFNKLGVNNRASAVGIALSYGLCAAYEEGLA